MAVTTIFSGTTTANTPTAWVAVPAANKYTVQSSGLDYTFVEYSVDGTNAFKLVTNQSSAVGTAASPGFTVNTPVLWARVNPGPNAVAVLATIINI